MVIRFMFAGSPHFIMRSHIRSNDDRMNKVRVRAVIFI